MVPGLEVVVVSLVFFSPFWPFACSMLHDPKKPAASNGQRGNGSAAENYLSAIMTFTPRFKPEQKRTEKAPAFCQLAFLFCDSPKTNDEELEKYFRAS